MPDSEAFYLHLPISLQHVVCSIKGWQIKHTRFGYAFEEMLKEVELRSGWSKEQTQDYRDRRVRAFVHHCATNVPYYRSMFQDLQIDPRSIYGIVDLSQLPILKKQDVQEFPSKFTSETIPKKQCRRAHTSGTTGSGLHFATTHRAIHEQWAIWWRYRHWHGLTQDTWCGYFGGRSLVPLSQTRPPFWRLNIPGKQILFSAYHMRPETLDAYLEILRQRRPPWLHGYPSQLAYLAAYMLETGQGLGYEIKWITTGAENLLVQQAEIIEKAFAIQPIQHYGMAEGIANISMCEAGSLHVDEDYAAVEFVPNPDGQGFKVIGTNFTNLATPLLRYDVQDIVSLPDENEPCCCGKPGRIVSQIDGRQEDYIVLKNGAFLGRMDHIFKDMVNIREAQLYQRKPGEIFIRIVRANRYSEADERRLLHEFRKRVGENENVNIVYVHALERSKTGKLRFVLSELNTAHIDRNSV